VCEKSSHPCGVRIGGLLISGRTQRTRTTG
jgi:hypothetical protein